MSIFQHPPQYSIAPVKSAVSLGADAALSNHLRNIQSPVSPSNNVFIHVRPQPATVKCDMPSHIVSSESPLRKHGNVRPSSASSITWSSLTHAHATARPLSDKRQIVPNSASHNIHNNNNKVRSPTRGTAFETHTRTALSTSEQERELDEIFGQDPEAGIVVDKPSRPQASILMLPPPLPQSMALKTVEVESIPMGESGQRTYFISQDSSMANHRPPLRPSRFVIFMCVVNM